MSSAVFKSTFIVFNFCIATGSFSDLGSGSGLGSDSVNSCEAGWESYGSSCYKYVKTRVNWHVARTKCLNMKADLIVLKDQEEQDFLYSYSKTSVWLGLSDINKEMQFEWVDSENSTFSNFRKGEPNDVGSGEDCAVLHFETEKWNDIPCYIQMRYVCEKKQQTQCLNGGILEIPHGTTTSSCNCPSGFSGIYCEINELISCEAGWESYGGSCYKYVKTRVNWHVARTNCLNMNADLIVLKDQEEQDFLYSYSYSETSVWLGLSDINKEMQFEWVDSENSTFLNFRKGEPNNVSGNEDCAVLHFETEKWNDIPCYIEMRYVCEKQVQTPLFNPCLNGGILEIPYGTTTSSCNCTSGFSGTNCEINEICPSNPCKNNGTCALNSSTNGFICLCSKGYTGHVCQEYIAKNSTSDNNYIPNFCSSNPCKNNGTCALQNSMNGYICLCSKGYSGHACQEHIAESNSSDDNCIHSSPTPVSSGNPGLIIRMFFLGIFLGVFGVLAVLAGCYIKKKVTERRAKRTDIDLQKLTWNT